MIKIVPFDSTNIVMLAQAYQGFDVNKNLELFKKYLLQQELGKRWCWLAMDEGQYAGYVTIFPVSEHPAFAQLGYWQISDLSVLPAYRRQGVASELLDEAEGLGEEKGSRVVLGVGLYADYGPAMKLYNRRGYRLAGLGITYNNLPVDPGAFVRLDDDLLIWLIKDEPKSRFGNRKLDMIEGVLSKLMAVTLIMFGVYRSGGLDSPLNFLYFGFLWTLAVGIIFSMIF